MPGMTNAEKKISKLSADAAAALTSQLKQNEAAKKKQKLAVTVSTKKTEMVFAKTVSCGQPWAAGGMVLAKAVATDKKAIDGKGAERKAENTAMKAALAAGLEALKNAAAEPCKKTCKNKSLEKYTPQRIDANTAKKLYSQTNEVLKKNGKSHKPKVFKAVAIYSFWWSYTMTCVEG